MGSTNNRWQDLILFGERLFSLIDVKSQIALIEEEFGFFVRAEKVTFVEKKSVQHDDQAKDLELDIGNCVRLPVANDDASPKEIQFFFSKGTILSNEDKKFLRNSTEYFTKILSITKKLNEGKTHSRQLDIIRSILADDSINKDPEILYTSVAEKIRSIFGLAKVAITLREKGSEHRATQYLAQYTTEGKGKNSVANISLDEGAVSKCFQKEEIIFSSYRNEGESVYFPICENKKQVGVLELWSGSKQKSNQALVDSFALLTSLIATVYQNSQLLNNALEQSWISNVMRQISDISQRYDLLEDQMDEITRTIPLMIDVEKCAAYLSGGTNSEYIFESQFGYRDDDIPKLAMLPYTKEGVVALKALEVGEPFFRVPSPCSENLSSNGKPGCRILFSLTAHENMHGVLLIDMSRNPFDSAEEDVYLLDVIQSVCRQIALSIENYRLVEEKEIETYTTTVLLQSAEAIALAAGIEEALENICNLLPFFLGVDTTVIYLLNQQQRTYHLNAYQSSSWMMQSKNLPQQFREGNFRGLDEVLSNITPSIFKIDDIPPEDWLKINHQLIFQKQDDYQISEPLLMVFPLHIQEEISGFMLVCEAEEAFENREKKIEILNGIARQISVAVQTVQLKNEVVDRERIRREFQFAQEIQRTFLPKDNLEIPGYTVRTLWRPALQLGGDFYDLFPLPDHQYGFVIADVSDKGMPAALYMTVARTLIHAAAKEERGPAETLMEVNRQLMENSSEGLFVTVIYGILTARTGEFVYSNAGHNKPILIHKKQIQWLEKGGMPLGITDNMCLAENKLRMEYGDEIILYTDGVTECRTEANGFFGEERLQNILNANILSKFIRSNLIIIDEKLLAFQGNDAPSDDVTVLTIKRMAA